MEVDHVSRNTSSSRGMKRLGMSNILILCTVMFLIVLILKKIGIYSGLISCCDDLLLLVDWPLAILPVHLISKRSHNALGFGLRNHIVLNMSSFLVVEATIPKFSHFVLVKQ